MSPSINYPFRVLDHSGDLRLEAWGEDDLSAIAHASLALTEQIVPLAAILEQEVQFITAEGEDEEARIIALLNEVLYLIVAKNWLPRRIRTLSLCSRSGCRELTAELAGEPFDPARHEYKYDVKAVTYHGFELQREAGRTVIRFVCDL